jgi:IS605 OrfB family transposase
MGKNISFKGVDRVSIGGLQGRIVVPFLMGKYQQEKFALAKGQCDLVLRHDGQWFLLVTVDVPEATKTPVTDFLGVDLGVENIAFDSDGRCHSSEPIETQRRKYAARRRSLGNATKDADRNQRRRCHKAMARTKAKEARFRRDINHQISKRLVASAKGTGRGIALEDLDRIRERITVRRQHRDRFNAWAFDQLGRFIVSKGKVAGVLVAFIDPAYTSQTCSECGHCESANRTSQAEFVCQACGYRAHADFNAARNHRDRARVHAKVPMVTERGEQRTLT